MPIAASYHEARHYAGRTTTEVSLPNVAAACGLRMVEFNPVWAKLRARFSIWSFGEVIEVNLAEVRGGLLIDVNSRCTSPTQIEDWGKNRKNVQRLLAAIETQLGTSCAFGSASICPYCGYVLVAPGVCSECGRNSAAAPVRSHFWRKLSVGVMLAIALSAAETVLVNVLARAGLLPGIFGAYAGVRGAFRITFLLNLPITVAILAVAHIWNRPQRLKP